MDEHVYWTWEATIQPGKEEGFKALAKKWDEITAADPDTLYSSWSTSEDGKSVRVDQRFVNADAAMAQYRVNDCWGQLDDYLVPAGMVVCGHFKKTLDFLRDHGAKFMPPL